MVDALACCGAGCDGFVAYGCVGFQELVGFFGRDRVDFVEADDGFDLAVESGDDVAVDEVWFGFGFFCGGDDDGEVNVGDDGVFFFPDDAFELSVAWLDGFDDAFGFDAFAIGFEGESYDVADGDGVSAVDGSCSQDASDGAGPDGFAVVDVGGSAVDGDNATCVGVFGLACDGFVVVDDDGSFSGEITLGEESFGGWDICLGVVEFVGEVGEVGLSASCGAIGLELDANFFPTGFVPAWFFSFGHRMLFCV